MILNKLRQGEDIIKELGYERYYIFENNNKFSKDKYTYERAIIADATLLYCRDCIDCENCSGCSNCSNCTGCSNCSGLSDCEYESGMHKR
jgi:hypothetical protein